MQERRILVATSMRPAGGRGHWHWAAAAPLIVALFLLAAAALSEAREESSRKGLEATLSLFKGVIKYPRQKEVRRRRRRRRQ